MSSPEIKRIASLFPGRWDSNYVASKLRTDPLYTALAENLRGSDLPLLDLGCGLGLLAFFLRSKGISVPIHGLDYDERKIRSARLAVEKSGVADLT
ncbi:MAG: methyltransferase domain-containing protein, partial [Verrucomicrobiaceae bacterium]